MTNHPVFQRLLETSWQRTLTCAEQAELEAWLKAHPEAATDWEAEAILTSSLARLPDAAVPSNFTSRVLHAVELEAAAERRLGISSGWWQNALRRFRWAIGTAFASLALVVGVGVHNHHRHRQAELTKQQELVKTLELVTHVNALPNAEVLTNFEAIRLLGQGPQPDEQLLALLQ
jgi:hypothetical protein